MKKQNARRLLLEDPVFGTNTLLDQNQYLPPSITNNSHNTSNHKKPIDTPSNFDSSMVVTILVLLTALFFMGFFSIYIRRFSEANTVEIARRRRLQGRLPSSAAKYSGGVDPTTIKALPMFAYQGSAKEPFDCAVCLSEFEENETVKMIPHCGHVFHPRCIDVWLCAHASCPLCRSTQLVCSDPLKGGDICLMVSEERDEVSVGLSDRAAENSGQMEMASEGGEARVLCLRRSSSCSRLGKREMLLRSCSF